MEQRIWAIDLMNTLSIPKDTTIKFGSSSTALVGTLTVSGNVTSEKKVVVTTQAEPLKLDTDEKVTLSYALKYEGQDFSGAEWDEGN